MTSAPAGDGAAALVEELWRRFQPLASRRVAVLEDYAAAMGAGQPADEAHREAASRAAHDLEGSLGSYARPAGSAFAAEYAEMLHSAAPDPSRLAELAAALRAVVGP